MNKSITPTLYCWTFKEQSNVKVLSRPVKAIISNDITIAFRFRMTLSPEEDITRTLKAFLSGRTKFAIPLSRK